MKVLTSIGPNRIPRQQFCINSWIARGCSVTAVQSAGEAKELQPLFPSVNFVETDLVGTVFGRPKSVRIKALLDQVTEDPTLIVNSDIHITSSIEDFQSCWGTLDSKTIKVGVRWDYCPDRDLLELLKYGIDIFLITPDTAKLLPDIGMTIGCPGWDYWIPWHLNMLGVKILTSKRVEFVHEIHNQNWSKEEYNTGIRILTNYYSGMTSNLLSRFIQELTQRTHLKAGKLTT